VHTFHRIVRNALTVALLAMFSMSASQALAAPAAQTNQGPPCVTVDGQTYCEDGAGPECIWVEGRYFCAV
jgi:uncharacterized membrane protein